MTQGGTPSRSGASSGPRTTVPTTTTSTRSRCRGPACLRMAARFASKYQTSARPGAWRSSTRCAVPKEHPSTTSSTSQFIAWAIDSIALLLPQTCDSVLTSRPSNGTARTDDTLDDSLFPSFEQPDPAVVLGFDGKLLLQLLHSCAEAVHPVLQGLEIGL